MSNTASEGIGNSKHAHSGQMNRKRRSELITGGSGIRRRRTGRMVDRDRLRVRTAGTVKGKLGCNADGD